MNEKKWSRGDIYYVKNTAMNPDGKGAGKLAIIVSNNEIHDSAMVQIVYLTTHAREDLATHIDIRSAPKNSIALCEQIRSVPVIRLGTYVGSCDDVEMKLIDAALTISLGLDLEPTPERREYKTFQTESDKTDEGSDAIIELIAQRDTYKHMYESLLERVIESKK